ncbi:class F sortase [Patescibacteria group bacterium]|nr:class F sortase [Patescibacteria group bacterium]
MAAIKNWGLLLLAAYLLFSLHPNGILASDTKEVLALRPKPTPAVISPVNTSNSDNRLIIPAIGLDTKIVPTGLGPDGLQVVPDKIPGWYALDSKPGERGNAVLVGHTPGIFSKIINLKPGDKIYADGATYEVTKNVLYTVSNFPTSDIYGPSNDFNLIMITCTGISGRTVVFSNRILTPR